MKKKILVAIITTTVSLPTMAEFLGIYAGIDYRTTTSSHSNIEGDFRDTNNLSGYITVEHFVPLIPNAKLKYSDLSAEYSGSQGSKLDSNSSMINAIAYYRLFNNNLFEFDLGLAYSRIDAITGKAADIAQAYGAAKIHVPGVSTHLFTEVIAGSINSDEATDAEMGIAYTFNPDSKLLNFSVRAGYRYQEIRINNATQESKGLFVGLEAHF